MANGNRRPLAPVRKIIAAVLGTVALFVILFGLGMTSLAIVALGVALLVLAIGLVAVNAVRGGARAWAPGTAHVQSVSEPPPSSAYGRCELQIIIDAPGLPARMVKVRDPRVPVAKWPDVGATLPIMVAIDDPRHVRILWDDVMTHAEAAGSVDDDLGGDPLLDEDDVDWRRPGGPAFEPTTADLSDDLRGIRREDPVVVHQTPGGPIVVEGTLVDPPLVAPLPRRAKPSPRPRGRSADVPEPRSGEGADSAAAAGPPVRPESQPEVPDADTGAEPAGYADPTLPADADAEDRPARPAGRAADPADRDAEPDADPDDHADGPAGRAAAPPDRDAEPDADPDDHADGPAGRAAESTDRDAEPDADPGPAGSADPDHSAGSADAADRDANPPGPAGAAGRAAGAAAAGATAGAEAAASAEAAAAAARRTTDRDPELDLDLEGGSRPIRPEARPEPPDDDDLPDATGTPDPTDGPDAAPPRGSAATDISDPTPDADPPAGGGATPPAGDPDDAIEPPPASTASSGPTATFTAPTAPTNPSGPGPTATATFTEPASGTGPATLGPPAFGAATAAAATAGAAAATRLADDDEDEEEDDEPAQPEGGRSVYLLVTEGSAEREAVTPAADLSDVEVDELITAYPSARPGDTGVIHGIGLTVLVTDLQRSVEFYRDTLGFQEIDGGDSNAILASGDTRIVLREIPEVSPITRRLVHLNLEVGDVIAVYENLRAKGVKFTYAPRAVNRGAKLELWAAAFRDPDGHGIALTQWRSRVNS